MRKNINKTWPNLDVWYYTYVREREMFYKVVIYKDYDGSKKLGHIPPTKDIVKMLKEGGSSHLGDSK